MRSAGSGGGGLKHRTRDATITAQVSIMSLEVVAEARRHPSKEGWLLPDPAQDEVVCVAWVVAHGGVAGARRGGLILQEMGGNVRPMHRRESSSLPWHLVHSEDEVCHTQQRS